MLKHEQTLEKAMKIICHGDSHTEGGDSGKAYIWNSLVGHNLRVPVVNHGIGGETTAGMLGRFSHEGVPQKPASVSK